MVPHIADQGHSFKGLVSYLMHDKGAETSERVAWHECSDNLKTQDPHLAAKVMASTDINSDHLKRKAGISLAGRKPKNGAVYHYLLSWENGNQPDQDHMRECVKDTLAALGLTEHEHMMISHTDTEHAHVHVVANLVHPETGKRHDVGLSKRKLSAYALQYEREHGLQCHAREENAQNRERGIVEKYQDQKRDYSAAVTAAFEQSDNGQSFVNALREQGLALANGNKGKFVVVDQQGNIDALTRNLNLDAKGRAKTEAINAKFADINRDTLLQANDLAAARIAALEEKEQRNSPENVIERMEKHHAAFTKQNIERELYRSIPDDGERRKVIDSVLQHENLLNIGDKDGRKVYATQQMIDLEKGFVKTAQQMHKQQTHGVDDKHRAAAIEKFNTELADKLNDQNAAMTAQQQAAIEHITQGNQLSNLVGIAGAGKSTVLSAAKDIWEAQGYRVRGAALSGIAAQGLQENGIEAGTLHSFEGRARVAQEIMQQQQGRALTPKQAVLVQDATLTQQDVLIIDEAGMVSTPQMNRVMEMAQQAGSKIVMVGDHEQLQSIEAGAAFRNVLEHTEAAELDEVRRQQSQWQKDATINLAKGNVGAGLKAYDQKGCVHHEQSRDDAKEKLVSDLMQAHDKNADKSRMVLAYTRADVDDLNQQIKQQMIERGVVQPRSYDTDILVQDGDETRQCKEKFSIGDRLMFRQNSKELGVMNGTLGTIADIEDQQFRVTLDNGHDVEFDSTEYQKIQLGYAATVHKSQGVTVDEAYILGSRHFDRHAAYVAMSRHKDTAQLYTAGEDFKSKDAMIAALSKDGQNLSTLDFVQSPDTQHQQPQEKVKEQDDNTMRKNYPHVPEEVIIRNELTGRPNTRHLTWEEICEMESKFLTRSKPSPEEYAKAQDAAYDRAHLSPVEKPAIPLQQQFAENRADIIDHLENEPAAHAVEYAAYREKQQALLQQASSQERLATGLTEQNIALDGWKDLETDYQQNRIADQEQLTAAKQAEPYQHPEAEQPFNDTAQQTYDDIRAQLAEAKANYEAPEPTIAAELPRGDGGTVKIYDRSAQQEIEDLKATLETRQLSPENAAKEQFQQSLQQSQRQTPQEVLQADTPELTAETADQRYESLMEQADNSPAQSITPQQVVAETAIESPPVVTVEQRYTELMQQADSTPQQSHENARDLSY